jgi:hypothetical protein
MGNCVNTKSKEFLEAVKFNSGNDFDVLTDIHDWLDRTGSNYIPSVSEIAKELKIKINKNGVTEKMTQRKIGLTRARLRKLNTKRGFAHQLNNKDKIGSLETLQFTSNFKLANKDKDVKKFTPYIVEDNDTTILKEDLLPYRGFPEADNPDLEYNQLKSKGQIDPKLDEKLTKFINTLDVQVQANLDGIKDRNGNKINAIAKADLLNRTIEIAYDKAGKDTLAEETIHFATSMMKDSDTWNAMYEDIVNHPKYQEVKDEYGELYNQDEFKIRKEAVDQVITDELIQLYDSQNKEEDIKKLNWAERFIKFLKRTFGKTTPQQYQDEVYNPYKQTASDILDEKYDLFDITMMRTTEDFYSNRYSEKASKVVTQKDIIDNFNANNLNIDKSDKTYFDKVNNKTIKKTVSILVQDAARKLKFTSDSNIPKLKGIVISAYNGYILDSLLNNKAPNVTDAYKYVNTKLSSSDSFKELLKSNDNKTPFDSFIALDTAQFNSLVLGMRKVIKDINTEQNLVNPEGTVEIRSEQIIYNYNESVAGTMDLVAVFSDGSVGIYDFSSVKYYTDDLDNVVPVSDEKISTSTVELAAGYKAILDNSIGNVKIRQLRLIPIYVDYGYVKDIGRTNAGFTKVEMASEINPNRYLEHIPIEEEKTGYKKLDDFVNKIYKEKQTIRSNNKLSPYEKSSKLKELDDVLKILLVKKDVGLLAEKLKYLKDNISNRLLDTATPMTTPELTTYITYLNLLKESNLIYDDLSALTKSSQEEYRNLLNTYNGTMSALVDKLNVELNNRLYTETDVDLTESGTKINNLTSLFSGYGAIDNPVFRAATKFLRKANEQTRRDINEFHSKLESSLTKLKKRAKSEGKSLQDMYDMMIKGKNLYTEIDYVRFNEDKQIAIKKQSSDWMLGFNTFRRTDYEKDKTKYFSDINNPITSFVLKDDKLTEDEKKAKILDLQLDYERAYDIKKYPQAMFNPKNEYLIPNRTLDEYKTEEYLEIAKIAELKEFYDLYVGFMEQAKTIVGFNKLSSNFIANYSEDMFEAMYTKGLSSLKGLGKNLKQSLIAREDDPMRGKTDEFGNQLLEIPVYGLSSLYDAPTIHEIENIENDLIAEGFVKDSPDYTTELDKRTKALGYYKGEQLKSMDLGTSLAKFAEQVLNYKNLSAIETNMQALYYQLESDQQYTQALDTYNNKVTTWLTGVYKKTLDVPASTVDLFERLLRRELYGQKIQGGRSKITIGQTDYDTAKLYNLASNFMTLKSLGLSPILAMSNYVGAKLNLFMHFKEGIHFTRNGFNQGVKNLVNNDPKETAILALFEIQARDLFAEKANKLSANKLSKFITLDNILIGHKLGDDNIDKGILLGMSRHYVVDSDGKIKNPKTTKLLNPEAKTVYDTITLENGIIDVSGLKKNNSWDEIDNFKAKAQRVAFLTKGSMGKEQEMLGNTSIMFRAVTKFRGWMVGLSTARFQKLKYDTTLEMYNEGRLKAVWGNIIGNGIIPSIKEFSKLSLEVASFGLYSKEINERLLETSYQKFIKENPETKFSFEEFKEWYVPLLQAKLRGTAFELRALLSMLALTLLLAKADWDDDEETSLFNLYVYKIIKRSTLELSFFYDKGSMDDILKSPIPASGVFLNDLLGILTNAVDETYDIATGAERDNKGYGYYTLKHIVGVNKIMEGMDYWDKD